MKIFVAASQPNAIHLSPILHNLKIKSKTKKKKKESEIKEKIVLLLVFFC